MATQTQRWFIKQEGPNPRSLQSAVSWLQMRIAASLGRQGLLVIPNKPMLDNLEGAFGRDVVKALKQNNTVRLKSGSLNLMTSLIRPSLSASIVLVLYPPKKLLDSVDGLQMASEILVVPWTMPEIEPWIQTWSARELGSQSSPPPTKTFSNPTVRAALKSLTERINLSTGLSHPSDEAAAIDMFRLLRNAGETFDPDEVRSWLISELNWRPQQADEAANIAQKVLANKSFRADSANRWAVDIVSHWQEEGQKTSDE